MPTSVEEKRHKRRRKLFLIFGSVIVAFLLLHVTGVDAKAPEIVRVLAERLNLSVATKSKTKLPADIQKAIEAEAVKELTEGYDQNKADVAAEVDFEDVKIAESTVLPDNPLYIFKRFSRRTQEFLTFDPLVKVQIILKNNSLETVETLSLLEKSLKQNNQFVKNLQINIVASEIKGIENKFSQILSLSEKNRSIQAVAFNYAEKYFRSELILQGLEDKLDDPSMAKIESARLRGLGAFAKILTNFHPDPQVLARVLAESLSSETGTNYKEIKTTEILQEIEDATIDTTQKSSLRLAQYILIERFEKKVLRLSNPRRKELLTTLVDRLPGNPMREFKTLTRVRRVFQSRHLIVFTELYKARVLEHFENRVLGLSTTSLQNQFIESWVEDPADLRILEALELRIGSQKNVDSKLAGIVKNLKTLSYNKINKIYANNPEKLKDTLFYKSATIYPDVLDIKVAIDLNKVFSESDSTKKLESQIVDKFVSNLPDSLSGIVVPASTQTTDLLSEIISQIPSSLRNEVSAAITAETNLDSLEVPETENAIENLVDNLEQSQDIETVTQVLPVNIEEIISQADTQISQPTTQEILERTEELTEEIFSAPAGQETLIEENLPSNVQNEIENIQQTTNQTPVVNQTLVETVVNMVQETAPSAPLPTIVPEATIAPTTVTVTTTPTETPPPPTVSAPSL